MAEHGQPDGRRTKRRSQNHELPPDHKIVPDPRLHRGRTKGCPAPAVAKKIELEAPPDPAAAGRAKAAKKADDAN